MSQTVCVTSNLSETVYSCINHKLLKDCLCTCVVQAGISLWAEWRIPTPGNICVINRPNNRGRRIGIHSTRPGTKLCSPEKVRSEGRLGDAVGAVPLLDRHRERRPIHIDADELGDEQVLQRLVGVRPLNAV